MVVLRDLCKIFLHEVDTGHQAAREQVLQLNRRRG